METRGVRLVDGAIMVDDDRLERLAVDFTLQNLYERFGVTFEDYLGHVARGTCRYYFYCRRAETL